MSKPLKIEEFVEQQFGIKLLPAQLEIIAMIAANPEEKFVIQHSGKSSGKTTAVKSALAYLQDGLKPSVFIYDEYDTVFKDGDLTKLMIIESNGKAYHQKRIEYPLYKLLKSFLERYDIIMGGAVMIGAYQVRAVTIDSSFDIRNEPILQELYAFHAGTVNIQLSTPLAQNCAWAFNYDIADHSCTLEQYQFGETKSSVRYETLAEMLQALKEMESKQ